MAENNNTEILNRILEDLDLLIAEQTKDKDTKKSDKNASTNLKISGHEDVVALLVGLGAISKKNSKKSIENIGKMVQALAKGVKEFEDVKINTDAIQQLAPLINFVSSLANIGSKKQIKQGLKSLNYGMSRSIKIIKLFADELNSLKDISVNGKAIEGVMPLINFMNTIAALSDKKAVKAGLKNFKKIFSLSMMLRLKFWFKLLSKISNPEGIKLGMESINTIIKLVMDIGGSFIKVLLGIKGLKSIAKMDAKIFLNIIKFITTMLKGLPKSEKKIKTAHQLLALMVEAFEAVKKIPIVSLIILSLISKLLKPEVGESIGQFIVNLIKPLTELSNNKLKNATKAMNAISKIIKSIVLGILVLTVLAMIDITALLMGTGVVILVLLAIVGLSYLLAQNKEDIQVGIDGISDLAKAVMYISLAIGIMAILLKTFDLMTILGGTLIVLAIFAVLILLTKWLAGDEEQKVAQGTQGLMYIAGAVVILVLAIGILAMFIKSNKMSNVLVGALIVVAIMAALVGLVYWLSNMGDAELKRANWSLVIITAMLLVVSLITMFILIPLGKQAKEALFGGLIVVGILALLVLGVWVLSEIDSKEALKGLGCLALMVIMLAVVALIVEHLLIPIGELAKEALYGSGIVVGLLVALGAIMIGVGKLMENKKIKRAIIKGAATIVGIALVLYIIAELVDNYIDLAVKATLNDIALLEGSGILALLLGAWGLIMLGIGTFVAGPLALALAIGAGVITGISGILWLISQMMPSYIELCAKINETKNISSATNAIIKLITKFGLLMAAIGALTLIPLVGLALGAGAAFIVGISSAIGAIAETIKAYASAVETFKILKPADRKAFEKYMTDIDNGFVGTMNKIIEGLDELGVYAAYKAGLIARNLKPIFVTIKDFLTVILQFGQLKVVSEWDKDGKPVAYEKMTPQMFKSAADAISRSFCLFLDLLGKAMGSWDLKKVLILNLLKDSIGPVMRSVGTFVNAICKFISYQIPDEWDKDGKPTHYKQINYDDFANAAIKIALSFSIFMQTLGDEFARLNIKGIWVIECMKDSISPVMNAVKTFTDAISEIVNGVVQEFDEIGEDGKPTGNTIKKLVEFNPVLFLTGGIVVSQAFVNFLTTLNSAFEGLWSAIKMEWLLESMADIGNVIDNCIKLIDYILKSAEQMTAIDTKKLASDIATMFTTFINTLVDNSAGWSIFILTFSNNAKKVQDIINLIDVIYKSLTKFNTEQNRETYNGSAALINDLMQLFALSEIATAANIAHNNILQYIIPTVENIANLYRYIHDTFNDTKKGFSLFGKSQEGINLKAVATSISVMKNIILEINETMRLYNEGQSPNNVLLNFITDLSEAIKKMFESANESFTTHNLIFTDITKKYSANVRQKTVPTINLLIFAFNNLNRVFKTIDDTLIKKEKQRTEALKKLTKLIEEVGSATASLAAHLKDAQKNAIQAAREIANYLDAKAKALDTPALSLDTSTPGGSTSNPAAKAGDKNPIKKDPNKPKSVEELINDAATSLARSIALTLMQTFNNKDLLITINDIQKHGTMRMH